MMFRLEVYHVTGVGYCGPDRLRAERLTEEVLESLREMQVGETREVLSRSVTRTGVHTYRVGRSQVDRFAEYVARTLVLRA